MKLVFFKFRPNFNFRDVWIPQAYDDKKDDKEEAERITKKKIIGLLREAFSAASTLHDCTRCNAKKLRIKLSRAIA